MRTLVIHPFDSTTDFLSNVYKDMGFTVIRNSTVSHKELFNAIKNHDRIICLGHGTEQGLIAFNRFIINSKHVQVLREKECICVWCNANVFFEKYKLKGFYTGMIISEMDEAVYCCVPSTSKHIEESNKLFADSLRKSLEFKELGFNFEENMKRMYDDRTQTNGIIFFNKQNIFSTNF